MKILGRFCAVLLLSSVCSAADLVVDVDGGGDYTEIQSAINASAEGADILVKPGIYVVTASVSFGGKAITLRSEAGAEETVIQMAGPNGSVFVFDSGETEQSVLEGFTITGGQANTGGGVHCLNSSPTLRGCVVTNNRATEVGGGVFCESSSPTITDCRLDRNVAVMHGGGLFCYEGAAPQVNGGSISGNKALTHGGGMLAYIDCAPEITGTTISGNSASKLGGALNADVNCSISFTDCWIVGNYAGQAGGGLLTYRTTSLTVSGCVIAANKAQQVGGALASDQNCTTTVTNSTIHANQAPDDGLVFCFRGSSTDFHSCILWGNTPDGGNCGAKEGCLAGEDPRFSSEGQYNLTRFSDVEIYGRTYPMPDFVMELAEYCLGNNSPAIGARTDGGNLGAATGECLSDEITFRRGDANDDGTHNLADAVFVLEYLFAGGAEPSCAAAADIDDNGSLELTDAVRLLNYLFAGAEPPPAPFSECDVDPTEDSLSCEEAVACEAPAA